MAKGENRVAVADIRARMPRDEIQHELHFVKSVLAGPLPRHQRRMYERWRDAYLAALGGEGQHAE